MKAPLRRPALTAAIAVLSAVGALVQLLPAPHEALIEPAHILPLEAHQAWFPQR
jgi:hypothetical protein